MPLYLYKAKQLDGKVVSGELDANDLVDLNQKLRLNDLVLVSASKRRTSVLTPFCKFAPNLSGLKLSYSFVKLVSWCLQGFRLRTLLKFVTNK